MKKIILSIIIVSSMLLAGCWDMIEPEKLGLVTIIGIDSSDGQIKVIVHELAQQKQSSSAQGSSGGGVLTKLHESTASTISEAIQMISASDFRRLYLSHARAVILSEELVSSEGVTSIIDFFERNLRIRITAWLLIAEKGQFNSIFSIGTNIEAGTDTGKLIDGIITNRPTLFFSANSLVDFLSLYWETGSEPYTSGISLIEIPVSKAKQEAGEKPTVSNKYDLSIQNTAVFRKDKLVGWMNNEESSGLLWATGKIRWGELAIKLNGKDLVLRVEKTSSKIKPMIIGEKIVMKIDIAVTSDIAESQTNINFEHNEVINKVQNLVAEKIKKQIIAAFEKSKKLKSDVFGYGNYFYGKYPKYWEQIEASWYDYYQDIELDIKVKSKVDHIGLSRRTKEGK